MTDPFPGFLAIRYGIMRKFAHSQLKLPLLFALYVLEGNFPRTVLSTSSCPMLALSGGPEQVSFVHVVIVGFQGG